MQRLPQVEGGLGAGSSLSGALRRLNGRLAFKPHDHLAYQRSELLRAAAQPPLHLLKRALEGLQRADGDGAWPLGHGRPTTKVVPGGMTSDVQHGHAALHRMISERLGRLLS